MSKSGKLSHSGGGIEVEWEIDDFFSLSKTDEWCLESPTFNFSGASWCLRCYPDSPSENNPFGSIGLYLVREDSGPPLSLRYKFGFKAAEYRKEINKDIYSCVFQKSKTPSWGFPNFIPRIDLLLMKAHLEPVASDGLTIICSLEHPLTKITTSMEKLSQDMKQLLLDGLDSDVTITVQGKEFPVHRSVLGARTPVFKSMFEHRMKKKNTVSIDDCDAGVFRTFLEYVYTGTLEGLSSVNMLYRLYEVADKYQVGELKAVCLECIKSELSVDTFCDVIDLGLKHDEKELVELATTFFTHNTKEITATAEWVEFMDKNAKQANKLLVKIVVGPEEE